MRVIAGNMAKCWEAPEPVVSLSLFMGALFMGPYIGFKRDGAFVAVAWLDDAEAQGMLDDPGKFSEAVDLLCRSKP